MSPIVAPAIKTLPSIQSHVILDCKCHTLCGNPENRTKKTLCGNLKTTCNNTLVETFLSLTIHRIVESTCTFWETLKPRSKQKPKWFRQQPYIHSIDINFVMTIEDTKVSLIAIHILVGNTENQPED